MRRAALTVLALVLAAPLAAAWPAEMVATPRAASLRDGLLVAGSVHATATGGHFGAPAADRLLFDADADVRYCPDRAGDPQAGDPCTGGEQLTGARLYIHQGGVVVRALGAPLELEAPATAAALGGHEVRLNLWDVEPGVYAGGPSVVTANGTVFLVRALRSDASLEVRGNEGFRVYNGTTYTLVIGNVTQARLEARGAFITGGDVALGLDRAPLRDIERTTPVEDLFLLLRALQPPEEADRRADVSGAFGLFQLVPGLLNGGASARQNFTLNGEPRDAFTFVRLEDARFGHDGVNWTGTGNATYMLDGDVVAPDPSIDPRFPVLIPLVIVSAAVAGRALTHRTPPVRFRRRVAGAIRVVGLLLLLLVAAWRLTPVLGFSPLEMGELALRSRVQLALLTAGMVASAYLAIGFPSESIVRSAYAWRERPRAIIVPSLVGVLATLLFLLLATAILLSFVARFVRL